jgi:prolyl 4-hydroxylase
MQKSTVAAKEQYHPGRTSFNAFLTRQHDPVVECIEQRASLLTQKPLNTIEPLQVVWYRHGQKYEPHHDAFLRSNPESESELSQCGQRETTLFVYLNTVPESQGGHTSFPELSLKVPATKNDAAYWYNVQVNGEDDLRVLHGGDPVYGSDDVEKWGLNIWIREKKCFE